MRCPPKASAAVRMAAMFRATPLGALAGPCLGLAVALASASSAPAQAVSDPPAASPEAPAEADQAWAVHGQATFVEQGNLAFHSPYRGPNSLDPATRGRETADVTLYFGFRPWAGAEAWVSPEVDQGF